MIKWLMNILGRWRFCNASDRPIVGRDGCSYTVGEDSRQHSHGSSWYMTEIPSWFECILSFVLFIYKCSVLKGSPAIIGFIALSVTMKISWQWRAIKVQDAISRVQWSREVMTILSMFVYAVLPLLNPRRCGSFVLDPGLEENCQLPDVTSFHLGNSHWLYSNQTRRESN